MSPGNAHDRSMDLFDHLQARQGVARTQTLRNAGITVHQLRIAKADGRIRTVRRGWVALPDADLVLVAAATHGVVLTCTTLAARRGLWVLDDGEPHVAARPSAHAQIARGVIHWARPTIPRDPDDLEDRLENALILLAKCQPYEMALATWESALRRRLIDPGVLARMPLTPAARAVLANARPYADAGTETIFRTRLSWLDIPIVPQVWLFGHRVDFLIGDRLVIQIDGGHHVGPQRDEDNRHDANLRLQGYHVIRIGYHQLMTQWPQVQAQILEAIGQRLHRAS